VDSLFRFYYFSSVAVQCSGVKEGARKQNQSKYGGWKRDPRIATTTGRNLSTMWGGVAAVEKEQEMVLMWEAVGPVGCKSMVTRLPGGGGEGEEVL
jgi:hypothetical protein